MDGQAENAASIKPRDLRGKVPAQFLTRKTNKNKTEAERQQSPMQETRAGWKRYTWTERHNQSMMTPALMFKCFKSQECVGPLD